MAAVVGADSETGGGEKMMTGVGTSGGTGGGDREQPACRASNIAIMVVYKAWK